MLDGDHGFLTVEHFRKGMNKFQYIAKKMQERINTVERWI